MFVMNFFKEVNEAFYHEHEISKRAKQWEAMMAWDSIIDAWDRTGKGKTVVEHVADFRETVNRMANADGENRVVYDDALYLLACALS